jgi:hypothetical protein
MIDSFYKLSFPSISIDSRTARTNHSGGRPITAAAAADSVLLLIIIIKNNCCFSICFPRRSKGGPLRLFSFGVGHFGKIQDDTDFFPVLADQRIGNLEDHHVQELLDPQKLPAFTSSKSIWLLLLRPFVFALPLMSIPRFSSLTKSWYHVWVTTWLV